MGLGPDKVIRDVSPHHRPALRPHRAPVGGLAIFLRMFLGTLVRFEFHPLMCVFGEPRRLAYTSHRQGAALAEKLLASLNIALIGLMKIIAANKTNNKFAPKFMQVCSSMKMGLGPDRVIRDACPHHRPSPRPHRAPVGKGSWGLMAPT